MPTDLHNQPSNVSSKDKMPPGHHQTEGVKALLGDPKKAIIKLAWPMIIAMASHTVYNLVDAIWVSGLGTDALAGVGFFFPFFFMVMALSTGLGVGGGAAISRRIGAKDKAGVDNVGIHTLVIMIILAVAFTLPFLIFSKNLFILIGAEAVLDETLAYGRIMFGGTIIIFFSMVATSILRAEGDAKRTMWVMTFGAVLNIFLDPIFIYHSLRIGTTVIPGLGLGIAGAAWATIISMIISSLILFYWLFIKRDTYVSFNLTSFKWDRDIIKDISNVCIPASVMQMSMAFTMLITNLIIVYVANEDGVAVFTVGWRIVTVAILPLIGISTAVTSVTGAAFGAKNLDKLKISYNYSIKLGLLIASIAGIITFIFAPQITSVFTLAEETAAIAGDITVFLQVICLFYPGVAFGMFSSAMFQGTGKGTNALIVTIIRTLVLAPPFALIFAIYFDLNLVGIWLGLVVANLTGSMIAYSWARLYINSLKHVFNKPDPMAND
jgi:putative MATE family efflux protein